MLQPEHPVWHGTATLQQLHFKSDKLAWGCADHANVAYVGSRAAITRLYNGGWQGNVDAGAVSLQANVACYIELLEDDHEDRDVIPRRLRGS